MKLKMRTTILVLLLFMSFHASAGAQSVEVGLIERILEKRGKLLDSTPHASLLRVAEGRKAVRVRESLFYRDILELSRSGVLVDLSFLQQNLSSRAILGTRRLDEAGIYEIRDTTITGLSRMQLVIRQGVMVVEHAGGELEAVAAGIRARILGTTVVFHVEENEVEGLVFLKEGTMYYPDYDLEVTGPDAAWLLQEGQRPERVFLSRPEIRHWEREIQHNTRLAWRSPFWQQPAFYIPAAVVAGGGLYLLATRTATAKGSVVIIIPE